MRFQIACSMSGNAWRWQRVFADARRRLIVGVLEGRVRSMGGRRPAHAAIAFIGGEGPSRGGVQRFLTVGGENFGNGMSRRPGVGPLGATCRGEVGP